jgi:hypothetical protein
MRSMDTEIEKNGRDFNIFVRLAPDCPRKGEVLSLLVPWSSKFTFDCLGRSRGT